MATGLVITGARARFSINGIKIGYATGVSVREMITWEAIKVLDSIQIAEHVPTDYEVSMTADLVRLVGTTLKSLGFVGVQGSSPEQHLTNLLNSGELTATIEDNATNTILLNVEGVRVAEQNLQVTARGIVGQNVSMVAIRARDESDLS